MSYRGAGGYWAGPARRPRGDLFSGLDYFGSGGEYDESAGIDLSYQGGTPDFSDVIGGSSSAYNFSDVLTGGLGSLSGIFGGQGSGLGVGTALQKALSGIGAAGPGVGAGIASGAVAGVKAVKKALARATGGGGGGRRMNPLNVRAARRALRRLHGFDRIAKSILHVTSPKKKVHGFKFRRRKRR